MAITNIATDVGLIVLPIPVLWNMTLSWYKKLQLILLFGVGIFVVVVTAVRLPLIFKGSVAQEIRTLWASIEIATACFVSNVAFYYALLKDLRKGHSNSPMLSSTPVVLRPHRGSCGDSGVDINIDGLSFLSKTEVLCVERQ